MPTPCNTYVQIVQNSDPCNGETKPASCVIDPTLYSELGLEINSTQQQINQALYLTIVNLNATINDLQTQIDNLP